MKYLKGTRSLALSLSVDNMSFAIWFIDASHAVHWDCKGQIEAGMTLGRGAVISGSVLVGVDDAMPKVLCSLYFIQEQGYDMTHALIYQDNKSSILLEVNGKRSSTKRMKHIKNKYFFVTDKVNHEISGHCPQAAYEGNVDRREHEAQAGDSIQD